MLVATGVPPLPSLNSGRPEGMPSDADSAAYWFLFWWRKVREQDWPKEYEPIEFIQEPGEIVFVPARWWHAVLNLEAEYCYGHDTIAVTQNFCNEWNAAAAPGCAELAGAPGHH
eukprot:Skav228608  [mRNA]  locus=scaffold4464:147785:150017:- [translate_table: standard]